MATEMVPPAGSVFAQDDLFHARERIAEAIALQEMVTRLSDDYEEDFEMVKRACVVTFRLLNEASTLLSSEIEHGTANR